MKNFDIFHMYKLDKFHRIQLQNIEKDRILKSMNEEEYFKERLKKFKIDILPKNKKSHCKDDGVDFVIYYGNIICICQLKYWGKPIGKKYIKEIFGDMFLSNISLGFKEKNIKIIYMLICPFIYNQGAHEVNRYLNQNYYVIYGKMFVEFLINPLHFLNKIITKE